jgi:hypothetical protein
VEDGGCGTHLFASWVLIGERIAKAGHSRKTELRKALRSGHKKPAVNVCDIEEMLQPSQGPATTTLLDRATRRVMREQQGIGVARVVPARPEGIRDWQRWATYAAVAWSLVYAALGGYWVVSGRGFPYTPVTSSGGMGPLVGRFGPDATWIVVMMAGIPAAAVETAMLRGVRHRALRPFVIAAGALLAGILLLLMTGLNLLVLLGYVPYVLRSFFTGAEIGRRYLEGLTEWATIHQLVCLVGGFLWLAATVCYGRRSGGACPYCVSGHLKPRITESSP